VVQGVAFAGFTMISRFDRDNEVDPTVERPFIRIL
jgi:hypothetical protein